MKPKKSECGIECLDFVYDALERKAICKKCGRVVTMEEVIEGLKGAIKSAEYTDDAEACKIAILILQEQETVTNRNGLNRIESDTVKGCDWCANTEPGEIHTTVKRGNITFHDRAKLCPMCGRGLEE